MNKSFYKIKIPIILIIILFTTSTITNLPQSSQASKTTTSPLNMESWYHDLHFYTMVAFTPQDLQQHHITVNGLWNGFFADNLTSPFALGRFLESYLTGREYTSDAQFVAQQHNQSMLVPATILTTQGHISFQREKLEEYACRSIDGQKIIWDPEGGSYWMNANHPGFIDWCIDHGKKAIDANADMIVLDEIQGNSLVPLYQWASQYLGVPAPGYSNHTIEGFRTHLTNKYTPNELLELFDINDIHTYDLATRIAATNHLAYLERTTTDSLITPYIEYLHLSNYQAKNRLINEIRTYADSQGKNIIIGANSYTLGTNRGGGYWPKGLQFAEMVDVFTFENAYSAIPNNPIPSFPRLKWLAWEKLARAATNAPAIILVDTSTLEAINTRLFPLRGYSNYLSILCAEAFANQGTFVDYYFPPFGRERNWRKTIAIYDFIQNNKDLYDQTATIPTDLAILYLWGEGMRYKTDTYLGCAQALAESHIPFDVIFDGDGYFLNDSLTIEKIQQYPLIIVPSVINITTIQKNILLDYVSLGGTALIFNPEELGFPPQEGEIPYGNGSFYITDDIGYEYYHTYDDTYQSELSTITQNYINPIIKIPDANRRIVATPYLLKENKTIMHFVNYDHIGILDFIWPKFSITVQLKKPDYNWTSITLISPDFPKSRQLSFTENEEYIIFEVPYLKTYDVVIIE